MAGWLEEMARHPLALKSPGGAAYARQRLDGVATTWLENRASHYRVYFRQLLGALGLQVFAQCSLLGLGGWLVIERELTVGQLVAAELIVTAVVASLSKLGGKLESVYDLIAAANKLDAILHLEPEENRGDATLPARGPLPVRARDLALDEHDPPEIAFEVPRGGCAAILGSGAQVSHLFDALYGVRSAARGRLEIGGMTPRSLTHESLRERVALVRRSEPFPDTVEGNLRVAAPDAPISALWHALELVDLAERVERMTLALRTPITPTGAPFSDEEAIRLTLARALVAKPAVILLDRVADGLDADVFARLISALAGECTVVVHTRRPDLAAACEQQITLDPLQGHRQ